MVLHPRKTGRRRAATIVEMTFVLSIFLLFLLGILEYGRYLFFMHVAANATAQGARYAVVHTGDGTTLAQVKSQVDTILGSQKSFLTGYTVSVFPTQAGVSPPTAVAGANWNDAQFGAGICVKITGSYTFVAGNLIGVGPKNIDVSAVMTSEAN
ncbi:MAG: pilus assembly protein [Gemmataceae bacterium]|nr:pilus assembly protein [Gemmataceae bacterium]